MAIHIKTLPALGIAATNCYVIGDDATGEAVLIDPVDDARLLMQTIRESRWTLKLILATHGHFDHVLASKALKDMSRAPFAIHQHDEFMLKALPETGLRFTGTLFPEAASVDRYLTDAPETIRVGNITLETLFTPGHAPGHIAFYLREHNTLFAGDCLFAGSIGRTDLPGGNYPQLMASIVNVLLPLGDEVVVKAGHGEDTTLGQERRTNPFILDYLS